MDKTMNITLNRLPARTWNRLKMNEAVVQNVKVPVAKGIQEKEEKNAGNYFSDGLKVHPANEEEKRFFANIETALGKDLDKLGEAFPIEVVECADEETGKEENKEKIIENNEEKDGENNHLLVLPLTPDGQFGRYFLHVKKDSQMNVAVYCTSKETEVDSLFLQLKVYAEANARIDITVVQTVDKNVSVFSDIGGILEKNAAVNLVKMELGGKKVYSGVYMDLKGDFSSFEARIGYLGEEKQHLDMNYVARHHGRKTQSLMESSGVLDEDAFKLFRGTIDFVKGCSESVGNEKEDVLLFGENVVNQTIPLILCAEEDVEGNHGASIGELDEKTLFYLMSRGFTAEKAKKMIAKARLEAVAAQIKEDSVREKTRKYLEERL